MKIDAAPSLQFKYQTKKLKAEIKQEITRNMVLKTRMQYYIKHNLTAPYKVEAALYASSRKKIAELITAEKDLRGNRVYDPNLGQLTKNLGKRLGFASRGVARLVVGVPLYGLMLCVAIPALIGASIMTKLSTESHQKVGIKGYLLINSIHDAVFTGSRLDFYRSYVSETEGMLEKRYAQMTLADRHADLLSSASKFPTLPQSAPARLSSKPPVLPEIHELMSLATPRASQQEETLNQPAAE